MESARRACSMVSSMIWLSYSRVHGWARWSSENMSISIAKSPLFHHRLVPLGRYFRAPPDGGPVQLDEKTPKNDLLELLGDLLDRSWPVRSVTLVRPVEHLEDTDGGDPGIEVGDEDTLALAGLHDGAQELLVGVAALLH